MKKDFINELEKMLPEENIKRARFNAEKEIFRIKLSKLRKEMGLTQKEFKNFNQTNVSKIEKRKDLKLSTLIDYIDDMGLNLEIDVFPKKKTKNIKKIILLKT